MGTSLNGLTPANTYQGLIKFGDNSALTSVLKALSDGNGNDTMLELSTTALQIGGTTGLFWDNTNKRLGVGTSSPTVQFEVQNNARIRGDLNLNGALNNSATGLINIGGLAYVNNITNNVGVGINAPTSRLQIRGSGSTAATTALLVQNSSGTEALTVNDAGTTTIPNLQSFGYSSSFQRIVLNAGTATGRAVISAPATSVVRLTNALENDFDRLQFGGGTASFPALKKVSNNLEVRNADDTFGAGFSLGSALDASAILQASSTTKGFLPPKMTTTQKNAIASPASGLQVYDTTLNQMSYYNGTSWINF